MSLSSGTSSRSTDPPEEQRVLPCERCFKRMREHPDQVCVVEPGASKCKACISAHRLCLEVSNWTVNLLNGLTWQYLCSCHLQFMPMLLEHLLCTLRNEELSSFGKLYAGCDVVLFNRENINRNRLANLLVKSIYRPALPLTTLPWQMLWETRIYSPSRLFVMKSRLCRIVLDGRSRGLLTGWSR